VHTANGKKLLLSIVDAQLSRAATDSPTRGDNRDAAPGLAGGQTF
jgi:hypothetical protein